MLNKAKNLKIRRIKTIKFGKKLSFIKKFDVCIDVNKHQTQYGTVWCEFFENSS